MRTEPSARGRGGGETQPKQNASRGPRGPGLPCPTNFCTNRDELVFSFSLFRNSKGLTQNPGSASEFCPKIQKLKANIIVCFLKSLQCQPSVEELQNFGKRVKSRGRQTTHGAWPKLAQKWWFTISHSNTKNPGARSRLVAWVRPLGQSESSLGQRIEGTSFLSHQFISIEM